MFKKIISGGQSGADLGGLKAAQASRIATGGTMPKGWLTENGPRPEYAELYGMVESWCADYRMRTEQNVRDADATLWFGDPSTPGGKATFHAIRGQSSAGLVVAGMLPSEVVAWIRGLQYHPVSTLNVAGNRESLNPGIEARVEKFMRAVIRRLKT